MYANDRECIAPCVYYFDVIKDDTPGVSEMEIA